MCTNTAFWTSSLVFTQRTQQKVQMSSSTMAITKHFFKDRSKFLHTTFAVKWNLWRDTLVGMGTGVYNTYSTLEKAQSSVKETICCSLVAVSWPLNELERPFRQNNLYCIAPIWDRCSSLLQVTRYELQSPVQYPQGWPWLFGNFHTYGADNISAHPGSRIYTPSTHCGASWCQSYQYLILWSVVDMPMWPKWESNVKHMPIW